MKGEDKRRVRQDGNAFYELGRISFSHPLALPPSLSPSLPPSPSLHPSLAAAGWFDVTPTGRVSNRFSHDLQIVDKEVR